LRAPDLVSALPLMARALQELPHVEWQLQRLEIDLDSPGEALDLPAGLAANDVGPRALLGSTWSTVGAVLDHEVQSLARLGDPNNWLAALGWPDEAPELRFALHARFDPDRAAAREWSTFGDCRVWLPMLELDTEARRLALNWVDRAEDPGARAAMIAAMEGWRGKSSDQPAGVRSLAWDLAPEAQGQWYEQVSRALQRIDDPDAETTMDKIVLARRLDGILADPVQPADLLRSQTIGANGWPWWIERDGWSWLGESPELLGSRDDHRLRTIALAGTRPRGEDSLRDDALGQELLACDKDRREQAAVADWIEGRLQDLTGTPPVRGDLELTRLANLQHLSRRLEVGLGPDHTDSHWIDALHPTPALCGAPRVEVRRWLRQAESFDRGLYGGLVGWLSRSRAEVSVAIRGLLMHDQQVSAYAGAGLVRGSDPELEWNETNAKLGAVCRRLGLQSPGRKDSA